MNINDIINDRYILVRSIGRGNFGEVWLATDQKLGINVAIKIYISLDSRGLDEFKNEFKSVYNFHHPNLLRADYFDNVGSNPYLVMPYCPFSVSDKVGKMNENEIWQFIKEVSSGLAYLHANDIIHRDIKPDNILKDEQGNYVITDFGLSTRLRSTLRKASARLNKTSDQSGTIGYMAPEMFSSQPNAVKSTDIWALGATIYELATGDMPFCGHGGIMELHGAELPDLPEVYSKDLLKLMHRCLAKDPWDRPTAKEISEIADSVNSEGNVNKTTSESVDKIKQKYEKQIEKLKKDLAKNNLKSSPNELSKVNKLKNIYLIILLSVSLILVLAVIFGLKHINKITDDYEEQLYVSNQKLDSANNLIDSIEKTCTFGSDDNIVNYEDWYSTNHTHSSQSSHDYNIYGYQGDEIILDYFVDSESYDHFKTYIIKPDGNILLKDISGLNKSGSVSYTLPHTGLFILEVEYNKDASIHSGRDSAVVSNVRLKKSSIGSIMQSIDFYKKSEVLNDSIVKDNDAPTNNILSEENRPQQEAPFD